MKNFVVFILAGMLISLTISCQNQKPMFSQGISQGIAGLVLWFGGDLMPGIDKKPVEGQPLQREILIYELTHPQQAEVEGTYFYRNLTTKLISRGVSGTDGRFYIALEPGTYSLFVREPQGLFANHYDLSGNINPVTVGVNELVNVTIRVDYNAAY